MNKLLTILAELLTVLLIFSVPVVFIFIGAFMSN
jgi:hypothetical protein